MVPSEHIVFQSEPIVVPSEDDVVPSEHIVVPSEHIVVPSKHDVAATLKPMTSSVFQQWFVSGSYHWDVISRRSSTQVQWMWFWCGLDQLTLSHKWRKKSELWGRRKNNWCRVNEDLYVSVKSPVWAPQSGFTATSFNTPEFTCRMNHSTNIPAAELRELQLTPLLLSQGNRNTSCCSVQWGPMRTQLQCEGIRVCQVSFNTIQPVWRRGDGCLFPVSRVLFPHKKRRLKLHTLILQLSNSDIKLWSYSFSSWTEGLRVIRCMCVSPGDCITFNICCNMLEKKTVTISWTASLEVQSPSTWLTGQCVII